MVSGRPSGYLFTMVPWRMRCGWKKKKGRKEGKEERDQKSAEEQRDGGKSESGCQMSCRLMHWLTSLYRRREVRERHRQSVGRGDKEREIERERKSGRKHECLFADDSESPPLFFFFSPPTVFFLSILLYMGESACECEWRAG